MAGKNVGNVTGCQFSSGLIGFENNVNGDTSVDLVVFGGIGIHITES